MSIGTFTPPPTAAVPPPNGSPHRLDVFVPDHITVPGWVVDLESYRRWATSCDYPESGWVSFLDGTIFVDPHMEELFTHNQVKGAYAFSIMSVLGPAPNGMYVHNRMLLTNSAANLSTEPDGLFFLWSTIQSNRLRMIEGAGVDGFIELEGTPDMILEVVSKYSVRKDTVVLRNLYHKAAVPEFWLVDARGAEPYFEILQYTDKEYVPLEPVDGWLTSTIFQRQFQIVKRLNPLGQPQFNVNQMEVA